MTYALRMSVTDATRENLRYLNVEESDVQTDYLCTKQKQSDDLVLLKTLVQLHSLKRPRALPYCRYASVRLAFPLFPPARVMLDRERSILVMLMIISSRLDYVTLSFLDRRTSSQIPSEYFIYCSGLFCQLLLYSLTSNYYLITTDRHFLSSGRGS